MVTLTEDLLIDAGGWQVLREARGIYAGGRVSNATYAPPTLLGLVKGGATEYRSGLRINSKTDIENLCTCPDSRRRGVICAHSIAVALEVMKPSKSAPVAAPKAIAKPTPCTPPLPISQNSTGPEIEIHIILPPKFTEAWAKGSITVALEAAMGGQRKPFATLDAKKSYRADAADLRFAEVLFGITEHKFVSMAILTREQASAVLSALTGHPRVTFGKAMEAVISEEGMRPRMLIEQGSDQSLRLKTELLGPAPLLSKTAAWSLSDGVFKPISPGLPAAYFSVLTAPVTIPAIAAASFIAKELPMLAGYFTCEGMEIPEPPEPPPTPPPPRLQLILEGSLSFLSAKFLGASDPERLRKHGFMETRGEIVLKGEREILGFLAIGLPALQRDWTVQLGERFQHVTRNVERIEPKLEVRSSGEQWFDLSYDMKTTSGESFSPGEIARLLQTGQNHIKRNDGKITIFDPALLDDFSQLLTESNPEQRSPGLFRLQKRQAGAIHAFASEYGTSIQGDTSWKNWAGGARKLEELIPVPLQELDEVLRPYQKQGVYWLNFLAQNRFGGILADEMGLGKTLQSLAFLRTLKGGKPSLIVCPSSLIFNWKAEATRWVPELKIVIIEGAKRATEFAQIPSADIVITSYPLLRIDIDQHRQIQYAAAILDEAQQIKNPDSQNAQAACALRAEHRIALTGTPVENSVRDLWSIMNFLMPGYLGTRKEFRERYESSQPGGPEQVRLRRRIDPFLLRRTKQLVAKELPAKIEQIAWCELTPTQREIYTQLASTTRQQLSELSGAGDQKKSRMVMLTALLRLRQAACDARLLGMEKPPTAEEASAKLDMLEELLEEAIDGGHRVLVFSQFVSMLTHIRARLDAADQRYCYLDGQSNDRAEQVQTFQAGNTPIFLISLKAGGTGLNLTAADTVIHFDPWWNPAVEAQATDRAHRIGQKKVVTSYKLIARGTVEEKILNLQNKKKAMIAATLESEQPMMEGLTLKEIEELLA